MRRVFDQADQQQVDQLLEQLRKRTATPFDWKRKDQASERDCRNYLATIARAMRTLDQATNPVRGEEVRKLLYTAVELTHVPPTDIGAFHNLASLADLLDYSLSTSDPAVSNSEVWQTLWGSYVTVNISGMAGPDARKYCGGTDISVQPG